MKRKPFGATGIELPVIGQGTWDMPERGAAKDEAVRALHRGIELGMTHIDTAEMYGSGHVEQILGEALAGVPRDDLFITTKVLPSNATYRKTIAACEHSLRRLRMEYVDLYLLHWPSHHPIEETMRALADIAKTGKARFVGVSNFDLDELREAHAALPGVPMAANQVLHHLRERTMEANVLPYCREHGIAIIGYTPFGRGRFPRAQAQPGGPLDRIAKKHGAKVRQVILSALTHDPLVFAIPKASSVAHVEENAGAANIALDEDDMREINEAFPIHDGPLATL